MQEYDLYLPTTDNEGAKIPEAEMEAIKQQLVEAFGGYTHLNYRFEGAWKMGGVVMRDAVTVLRVLDDGSTRFDWPAYRRKLEVELQQESVLIVRREVETI